MNKKITKTEKIIILLYSIALKFFMSLNSIRFSEFFTESDHAIFFSIGKALLNGKVLYKDVFDHKTPYIYFANAFGAIFEKNHLGLYIIEVILLFVSLYYAYKCFVFFVSKTKSLIGVLILGILLNIPQITFSYSRTEEYAIAFLIPSLYLFMKYYFLNNLCDYQDSSMFFSEPPEGQNSFETTYRFIPMLIVGILSGLTFMTNIRAVVLFVPLALAFLIKLIKEKKYLYILKFFLAGLSGFIISIIPYIIYMFVTDSVNDAIYAIFIYNINYFNVSNEKSVFANAIAFISEYFNIYIFVFISFVMLLLLHFDKYVKYSIVVSYIIAFIYVTFANRSYVYYLVILLPYFMSIYFFILSFFDKLKIKKDVNDKFVKSKNTKADKFDFSDKSLPLTILIITPILFVIIGVIISYRTLQNRYTNNYHRAMRIEQVINDKNLNKENAKVLALGFFPEAYIYTNSVVNYKHFVVPNASYYSDKTAFDAQYKYIMNLDPDIIIFKESNVGKTFPEAILSHINYILNDNYTLEDTIRTNEYEGNIYIFAKS